MVKRAQQPSILLEHRTHTLIQLRENFPMIFRISKYAYTANVVSYRIRFLLLFFFNERMMVIVIDRYCFKLILFPFLFLFYSFPVSHTMCVHKALFLFMSHVQPLNERKLTIFEREKQKYKFIFVFILICWKRNSSQFIFFSRVIYHFILTCFILLLLVFSRFGTFFLVQHKRTRRKNATE